ncbi:MAG: ribosome hibernation-promoting factor, HPF/YfiA family [Armatimonadota bacterium]
MLVIVKGKNLEITPALKAYAEKKLQRLEKYFGSIQTLEVTQSIQRNWHIVEVLLEGDGVLMRAEERGTDMYEAIDLVAKKLEEQVRRFKERLVDKGRAAHDDTATVEGIEEAEEPRIVRVKRFALKPMSPEEACQQMELLNHSFFVFLNMETDQVNVIYKRKDGNYGLIEAVI